METGSVTAAADQLNLTQPAVSRLLATLELELGFRLFQRKGRSLVPSMDGRHFYRRIEGTLAGIEEISSIAEDIKAERRERLRIAAIGPLTFSRFLPEGLQRLSAEFPDSQYSVVWRDRMDIDEWVASRQSDLGFTLLPVDSGAVYSEPITTVAAVAIVPAQHPLADRESLAPRDFVNSQLILPRRNIRLRQLVDPAFLESGLTFSIGIETSTAVTSCHLVGNGLGVSISDPFSATGISQDKLTAIRWSPEVRLTYGVIWPKDRPLSERAQRLVGILGHVAEDFKRDMPASQPIAR